ncbi:MAG: c-type cytochrome [Betaproteobacteria bacterium]|nr:c-type cytochrome [Betaproteobacteria bacterium]
MSAQHGEGSEGHGTESQGLINTPKQLITVVVASFLVPIIGIVLLVSFVTGAKNTEPAGSQAKAAAVIADRMRPLGQVWIAGEEPPAGAIAVAAVATAKAEKTGEEVYKSACASCHTSGALNAPKLGDNAAWAKLIPEGHAALTKQAIAGIRQMPARGGNPALTDIEMSRAVAYLANSAGAKFKEPPVAAPAAPAAPAAAAAAAAPAAGAVDGEAVYKQACSACHAVGAAGAPKSGDKAAWAPRIKKGEEALVASALKGIGIMPPKGGNASLTEAQIRAAVAYQIKTNR